MQKLVLLIALVLVVAVAGCGGGDGEVNSHNDRAQEEFQVCQKQADQIAQQQGVDAASDHLDQCVQTLANDSRVN